MSDTQNNFRRLNALRKQLGMTELKAWKESKAKLQAAIDVLQAKVAPRDTTESFTVKNTGPNKFSVELRDKNGNVVTPKVCPPSPELQAIAKRKKAIDEVVERRLNGADVITPPAPGATAKLGDAAKIKRPTQATTKSTGDTIKLADICREIGMDPKIARAKLRRTMTPPNITVGKYLYKVEGKALVITVLRGGK